MIFKAGKWIAQQGIKKRMATRKKMQKKSKPAQQQVKAQQAMKKHQHLMQLERDLPESW